MDRVIVYIDDAAHARQILAPLSARDSARQTHWVLVACAPRMTHRISKWVSHSARENWRAKWSDKLFAELLPALHAEPERVTTMLARGPLPELTAQLQGEGAASVVDARRPKANEAEAPRMPSAPARGRWSLPGTLGSVGMLLWLVAE